MIANDADDAVAAISTIKSLKLIPMECDLADLSSIDTFVKQNSGAKFDAVCYNAGIARNTEAKDVARTKQGFELTVGTSHVTYGAHITCTRKLSPV
jgi:NAD(P)-dependent dehydrogenase (short-subunit alcohol dehydrogenase family)